MSSVVINLFRYEKIKMSLRISGSWN